MVYLRILLLKTAMHTAVFLKKKKKLQAFDPPFDMSQNDDGDCHDCAEHMHGHNHADCAHSSERSDFSKSVVTTNNSALHAQHDCPREDAKSNECCREAGNKKASPQSQYVYFGKHTLFRCNYVKFPLELFRMPLFLKKHRF
jgi:hypothetical protein